MSSVPPSQIGDASRVALARLALDVVSMIPDVAGTDAGPGGLCVTADPPLGVLRGVSVIAQPDGRYEVDLCLVARMVPLLALADEIRRRLRARAARERLADRLGTVNVEFARALSAGETIVENPGDELAAGAEAAPVTAGSSTPPSVATGSDMPVSPIPPASPSTVPQKPPAPSGTPLPPPPTNPPPTARPGPSATPEEPTDSKSSPTPPPDPPGSPIPPPDSTGSTPSPDREPRS